MRFIFLFCCILWMQMAASQAEQKLPPRSKLIFFGDSHTAFGYSENGNTVQYQNHGYLAWVNALCPDIQIPREGIQAVLGETTKQMMSRLQPIQSLGAKMMVVLAGGNDALYGITTTETQDNLRRIYNAGLAAGMKVIALTILPRFEESPFGEGLENARQKVNAWIKAQNDIVVVDDEEELNDSTLYQEGIHLNPTGCLLLAKKLAAQINALMAHCLPGSADEAQLGFAGNLNPLLAGSTGSRNGASGEVATKWNLNASFAGTANVKGSKEASAGSRETQVITISGNYTGSSKRVSFNNYTDAPINLTAGDLVEGVAEVDIPAPMTSIKSMYLRVTAVNADYSVFLADGNSMFNTSPLPVNMPPGHYTLRTPPITVGEGIVGHLTIQIIVEFINTATVDPVAATLKISSIGIQRLPLSEGPVAAISLSNPPLVCPGKPVLLQTNHSAVYAYQWCLDSTDLAGQTAALLPVTEAGLYCVKVSSPGCAVLSEPVAIATGDCPQQTPLNKWTGLINSAWENPANWSLGVVPDAGMDVVIDEGKVPVVLTTNVMVRSIRVEKGSSVVIQKKGSLTVKQ